MTTTNYRLIDTPKHAEMTSHECIVCERELKHPVFLIGPSGVVTMGSGCAAVALYGRDEPKLRTKVVDEAAMLTARARELEEIEIERAASFAAALTDFHADRDTSALRRARQTYRSVVHFEWSDEHRMTFPAFIASVAVSGKLPEAVAA